jgi:uncharacterized protein
VKPDPTPSGRIVVAGGTGFLGLNLAASLFDAGCDVVLISRHRPSNCPWTHAIWDGHSQGAWSRHLDGAAAVVNLAGRSVDCIKTAEHCDEILRSRVDATLAIGRALKTLSAPPPVWVQMSTAHRYGDSVDVVCDEDSSFGYGLAPTVGAAWEDALAESALPDMRQVILRTSLVLGSSGGALPKLAAVTRMGFGGTLGHGRQGMSWIHEQDMNRLFHRAIVNSNMRGAYMATAPNPLSNREFMSELRQALRMPIGLPAAAWMVRIGAALIMRTDPDLALAGRYCVSRRLAEEGFQFRFSLLEDALRNLYPR